MDRHAAPRRAGQLRCWLPQGCTGATLALSLAALFWAGNFVAGRALRDDADPVTLNVLRWLLCLALLLPLVGRSLLRHWPVVRREWRLVLGLGATGIAAFHTLVYLALVETTAVNALLIVTLAPITIMAGAAAIGQERPSWVQWLGTLVSLVGAFVLVTRGSLETLPTLDLNKGDLWMLGAILAWAIYSLLLRRRPRDLPQDVTLAASIIAARGCFSRFWLCKDHPVPRDPRHAGGARLHRRVRFAHRLPALVLRGERDRGGRAGVRPFKPSWLGEVTAPDARPW